MRCLLSNFYKMNKLKQVLLDGFWFSRTTRPVYTDTEWTKILANNSWLTPFWQPNMYFFSVFILLHLLIELSNCRDFLQGLILGTVALFLSSSSREVYSAFYHGVCWFTCFQSQLESEFSSLGKCSINVESCCVIGWYGVLALIRVHSDIPHCSSACAWILSFTKSQV